MTIISLIAAIDEKSGLGMNNKLLCYLPADLQNFKSITMGKPIIMGRKTFESIGKPLSGRKNIVLTRSPLSSNGVIVVDSVANALNEAKDFPEIFIIGGAELFIQTLPLASRLYLTHIHHHFEADVHFPVIEKHLWTCSTTDFRLHDDKNQFDMTFCTYDRK